MNDGLAEYYEAQIDAAQQVQAEKSARLMREIYGEDVLEMCAKRCNQHMHYCKGPTREQRDKAHDKRLVIDDTLTEHEKVAKLANLLEQARRDGARLEVEIPGAAWGARIITEVARIIKQNEGRYGRFALLFTSAHAWGRSQVLHGACGGAAGVDWLKWELFC